MKSICPFFPSTTTMSDSSSAPILPFKPATDGRSLDDLDKELDHACNRPAVRHSIFLVVEISHHYPQDTSDLSEFSNNIEPRRAQNCLKSLGQIIRRMRTQAGRVLLVGKLQFQLEVLLFLF